MFCANLFDEVNFAGVEECFVFIGIIFFADDDTGETGTSFTKERYNGPGIDAGDSRDTGTGTP